MSIYPQSGPLPKNGSDSMVSIFGHEPMAHVRSAASGFILPSRPRLWARASAQSTAANVSGYSTRSSNSLHRSKSLASRAVRTQPAHPTPHLTTPKSTHPRGFFSFPRLQSQLNRFARRKWTSSFCGPRGGRIRGTGGPSPARAAAGEVNKVS